MDAWYLQPVDGRAPRGGEELFSRYFRGGEFAPFYIPREYMPQVDERFYSKLEEFAVKCGVEWSHQTLPCTAVHKH